MKNERDHDSGPADRPSFGSQSRPEAETTTASGVSHRIRFRKGREPGGRHKSGVRRDGLCGPPGLIQCSGD